MLKQFSERCPVAVGLQPSLHAAAPGDLWIGDRNFCTRAAILAARARGAHVLFREPTGPPRPTEDGDTTLRLLTTLPAAVEAPELARLYRRRWSVERLFGQLESALQSEVRTLGHPRSRSTSPPHECSRSGEVRRDL